MAKVVPIRRDFEYKTFRLIGHKRRQYIGNALSLSKAEELLEGDLEIGERGEITESQTNQSMGKYSKTKNGLLRESRTARITQRYKRRLLSG